MRITGMTFFVLFLWVSVVTSNSLSRPVYGTERYHRGSTSHSGMQAQHIVRQPSYENGYLTNNGYYYYPHHEYHSYGMPTYRGEYKPKTYYYSSGPSYNYYGDREPVSNPLDDLHEEILQEDEQERQSDMLGGSDYDDYYIDPSESLHDTYTNNFLRNMIDYNRQKEQLQRMQELQRQPQIENFVGDYEEEQESPSTKDEYFSDFDINPEEYTYQPKGEENFDLQKYWNELASSNDATKDSDHHKHENSNSQRHDADVEELKSLTKSNKDNSEIISGKKHSQKSEQNAYVHWDQPQALESSSSSSSSAHQKEHSDDFGLLDYDDDTWINWDRKRSASQLKTSSPNIKKLVSELRIRKRLLENKSNLESSKVNAKSPKNDIKFEGQKEKYVTEDLPIKVEETSAKQNQNHDRRLKQSIYDTIKQIINNEQDLKKTGTKKRKRFVNDKENLVTQLDSLRRRNN